MIEVYVNTPDPAIQTAPVAVQQDFTALGIALAVVCSILLVLAVTAIVRKAVR